MLPAKAKLVPVNMSRHSRTLHTEHHFERVLVLWTRGFPTPHSRASTNVLREVCAYLGSFPLFAVFFRSLTVFSSSNHSSQYYTLPTTFTSGTEFVRVDVDNLICLGGFPETSEAYVLNLPSLHLGLKALPNMHSTRCLAGVTLVNTSYYVFGSYPGKTSCEKLNYRQEKWTRLANMHTGKFGFSPARHGQSIYLPDVQKAGQLEAFDLSSEQFSLLPVSLPGLTAFSVSFVSEGKLRILVCGGTLVTWEIGSEESVTKEPCNLPSRMTALSNTPPVFGRNYVYWVQSNTGAVVAYRVTTSKISVFA